MEAPRDIYERFPVLGACRRHTLSSYCTLIRLVSINPGHPTDLLKCTLSQACVPWGYPFQATPEGPQTKYEALSYVWGDASVTSPILLNGYPFEVTLNLKAALNHLRLESSLRVLWVDAISINQRDVEERNQQVQAMTMIYKTAQRVIVWLGESRDGSDRAFDHLYRKASEMRPPPTQTQRDDSGHEYASGNIDPQISIATDISPEEIALLSRPWWSRIWVVQEIAVAQDVLVQCGKLTICWDVLRKAYAGPHSIYSLCRSHSDQTLPSIFRKLDLVREIMSRGGRIELLDLMAGYRYCQATDPRDKIFALMGLIPPDFGNSDERLAPDYAVPYEEIFMRTVRFLITVTGNLDILSYCDAPYDQTNIANLMSDSIFNKSVSTLSERTALPSWVPDWSRTTSASPLRLRNSISVPADRQMSATDDILIYKSCGNTRPSLRQSTDEDALILRGILFDKIKNCSGKPGHIFLEGNRGPIYDCLRLVKSSKVCRYKSENDRSQAFLRTLVADVVHGKRATESDAKALDDWVMLKQDHLGVEDLSDRIKLSANLVEAVSAAWNGRQFFMSEKGYMGLAPITTRAGDAVCILFGGQVPFILRERDDFGHSMIGECYVHGIMDGEAIGNTRNKKNTVEFMLR
jgi:hypothetical protein